MSFCGWMIETTININFDDALRRAKNPLCQPLYDQRANEPHLDQCDVILDLQSLHTR